MLVSGVALYLLVAAGVLAMAAKYAFGPAPAVHHDKALKAEGMEPTVAMQIVLRTVYVPMAAACAALTVVVVVLALGPIWDGELWACVTATVAALVLGVPTSASSWWFEERTGVRGPYRQAMALTVLNIVAFCARRLVGKRPTHVARSCLSTPLVAVCRDCADRLSARAYRISECCRT